jgi:hypothetical protein
VSGRHGDTSSPYLRLHFRVMQGGYSKVSAVEYPLQSHFPLLYKDLRHCENHLPGQTKDTR